MMGPIWAAGAVKEGFSLLASLPGRSTDSLPARLPADLLVG